MLKAEALVPGSVGWLNQAVYISLFTDARAQEGDELPDRSGDERGHWGDHYLPEGESLGSRLWLLKRRRIDTQLLREAQKYCEQALQHLSDDGFVKDLQVVVVRRDYDWIDIKVGGRLRDGQPYSNAQEYAINAL